MIDQLKKFIRETLLNEDSLPPNYVGSEGFFVRVDDEEPIRNVLVSWAVQLDKELEGVFHVITIFQHKGNMLILSLMAGSERKDEVGFKLGDLPDDKLIKLSVMVAKAVADGLLPGSIYDKGRQRKANLDQWRETILKTRRSLGARE